MFLSRSVPDVQAVVVAVTAREPSATTAKRRLRASSGFMQMGREPSVRRSRRRCHSWITMRVEHPLAGLTVENRQPGYGGCGAAVPLGDSDTGFSLTAKEGHPMSKILLLAAGAAGYVAGARAGRDRYEEIVEQAQRVWTNPKVRKATDDAKSAATTQAPIVKDKVADTASNMSDSSSSGGSGQHSATV